MEYPTEQFHVKVGVLGVLSVRKSLHHLGGKVGVPVRRPEFSDCDHPRRHPLKRVRQPHAHALGVRYSQRLPPDQRGKLPISANDGHSLSFGEETHARVVLHRRKVHHLPQRSASPRPPRAESFQGEVPPAGTEGKPEYLGPPLGPLGVISISALRDHRNGRLQRPDSIAIAGGVPQYVRDERLGLSVVTQGNLRLEEAVGQVQV
mmetsp:Transcript_6554/g.19365  ORF Transcript_6554/g.19365 Transcript_6554/m.19365 type:complete len:205 (-) Transcript_6554:1282-1896(-)